MFLKILAAIFAAYECYKMLNSGMYIRLIEQAKAAYQVEHPPEFMATVFFRRVMLIEFAYIIFAIALLFTGYWYFTIILFLVSFLLFIMDTSKKYSNLLLSAGSAVCAAILMTIVLA